MLAKAATVSSVRREISMEIRKNHTPSRLLDKESQKQDALAQKSFWLGVTTATSILSTDNLSKTLKKSRFKQVQPEKLIHENSKEMIHEKYLFDSEGQNKIIWDTIMGLVIFYSIIIIPYRIGFQIVTSTEENTFDFVVDIIFFLDILIAFNTAYVDDLTETVIIDRKKIATKYLRLWFWIDLASTIPFDRIFELAMGTVNSAFTTLRLIKIFRLTRMLKLIRFFKLSKIGTFIESFNINPALLGVQKLILQICFVAHLVACFWHFVATSDVRIHYAHESSEDPLLGKSDEETWLIKYGYQDKPKSARYVAAFYWTISTMLSIGYGDISGTNKAERIYCIFTMVLGGVMFGAVIAQVTRLIESRNPQARAFKEKMDELKAYLNEKHLPTKLKLSAKEAYSYFLSKKSAFAENAIFTDLPPNLLNKLVLSIYSKEVHRIILFRECEENFIVQLIIVAKPFQALPGTKIVLKGDVPDEIMFIMRGVVQFTTVGYTTDEGIVDAVTGYSTEGGYFGDFEYYKRTIRLVTHRAICNSSLMSIPTSVIDTMIAKYPITGEKITTEFAKRYHNFLVASQSEAIKQDGYRYYIKDTLVVDGSIDGNKSHSDVSKIFSKKIHMTNAVLDVIQVVRESASVGGGGGAGGGGTTSEEHAEEHLEDIQKLFLILPKDQKKIIWDIFIGLLILYSVMIIPVQIGFNKTPSSGLLVFDQVVDIFFGIDILVSMRTCYYDEVEDAYVIIPRKIYRHYLFTWFFVDFFSVMPFDLVLGSYDDSNVLGSLKLLKVIRLVRLLKLFRLIKLRKYLTRIEDSIGINPASFELIKIILEVAFIGHLTSCVYWYLSANLSDYAWFDKLHLRNASLSNQYITTLYWTFTTLSTVGYGDITPVDTPGQVVSTMIMILGGTVFGYIVANVSGLMSSLDVTTTRVNERIAEVSEYLTEKNASSGLTGSILKHVRYMFTQNSVFDENAIISRLPLHLSRQMIFFHHAETFSHISIFRFLENKGVILFLFRMMTPVFYDANNYICVEGMVSHELIFLVSGRANVYKARIQQKFLEERGAKHVLSHRATSNTATVIPLEMCDIITHLSPGDFFGYASMMLKKPYQGSVRTYIPCSVYSLHIHDISSLIHNYPAVAMSLQSALAQAVHQRSVRGKYERRTKRARFIENIATLYLKHAARVAAIAAAAPFSASANSGADGSPKGLDIQKSPTIINIFRSRSTKIKTMKSKEANKEPLPSRPSGIFEGNDLKIENFEETSDGQSHSQPKPHPPLMSKRSISPIHKKKYTTTEVVPMECELPELTDNKIATTAAAGTAATTPATKARWKMLRAVVHDPSAMAIIQESLENRREDNEEMKTDVFGGPNAEETISTMKRNNLQMNKRKQKASAFNRRSLSIAAVVRASIMTKKKENILVMLQGNEYYDSEEDKKIYDEFYFIKTKALQRKHRSCPDLSGVIYQQKRSNLTSKKLQRRMSFPIYAQEDWQETQQTQHLV